MNVQIINPLEYPGWDRLIQDNSCGHFFHTSAWARVLSRSYDYTPLYFVIIGNGRLSSLIPILQINSFLTGKRGVSLPFTDECFLIIENNIQFEAITSALFNYGKKAGWKQIELRNSSHYFSTKPASNTYLTHTLDLTLGEKQTYSAFRNSTKRNIKRANEIGVSIDILNTLKSVKLFYRLNCLTRKRHGLPPQPWSFFKNLFEHIIAPQRGFVVLASFQNKVIAAAIYFHFDNTAIYKFGAFDKTFQRLRPNNLVMWKAIKWCIQNGFKSFTFGRTSPENKGLLQYKRGWGANEKIIHYYRYDLRKDCFLAEKTGIKSTYTVFKLIPIPILRLTGNILYRHVG